MAHLLAVDDVTAWLIISLRRWESPTRYDFRLVCVPSLGETRVLMGPEQPQVRDVALADLIASCSRATVLQNKELKWEDLLFGCLETDAFTTQSRPSPSGEARRATHSSPSHKCLWSQAEISGARR